MFAGLLIHRGFRDHFAEHLPVETERAGLFGRDRLAEPGG